MHRYALALLLVSGMCAADAPDLQSIHTRLLSLYTPVDQPGETEYVNHSGAVPFEGDCDDYFTAAWNQMYRHGFQAYGYLLRVRDTGTRHLVACTDVDGRTWCLDPNQPQVVWKGRLSKRYRIIKAIRP